MKICGLQKTTLLDYPKHVACTIFTGGCNLRCPWCHNSELLDIDIPSEYTEEEIYDFLGKRKGVLEGVAISGGEPTLQKDLPEFIRKVRFEYGLDVKLDTNGTNPEMLRALIDEGLLNYVAMDLKAGPENYAKSAGVSEQRLGFERIERCIGILLENRVPYEFRFTVVDGLHTDADAEGIGRMIEGAEVLYLQAFKDSGNIVDREAGFAEPKKETLLRYREILLKYVKNVELRGIDY